jgi:hypothetical protein
MTDTLHFPSEAFPAFPQLSAPQPDGWVALAAVGLPLALAREVEGQGFRPNVLVTMTRAGADHGLDKALHALTNRLKRAARYKELSRETTENESRSEALVEGRFAGGKGELIKQIVRLVVIKRGFVYDVVEITGTVSLLTGDNGEDEMRAIVTGVEITID